MMREKKLNEQNEKGEFGTEAQHRCEFTKCIVFTWNELIYITCHPLSIIWFLVWVFVVLVCWDSVTLNIYVHIWITIRAQHFAVFLLVFDIKNHFNIIAFFTQYNKYLYHNKSSLHNAHQMGMLNLIMCGRCVCQEWLDIDLCVCSFLEYYSILFFVFFFNKWMVRLELYFSS